MTFRRLAAASVIGSAAVLAGCGGDSGTGPAPAPTFENIAGTYAGALAGISPGRYLAERGSNRSGPGVDRVAI